MCYRIEKTTRVDSSEDNKGVVWEGNLARMNERFPKSKIFGADPLGFVQLEDGLISITYSFFVQEGENWIPCDDPRTLRTEMSDVGREIDAENRRLFPGDYNNEYCEFCGQSNCGGQCQEEIHPDEDDYEDY